MHLHPLARTDELAEDKNLINLGLSRFSSTNSTSLVFYSSFAMYFFLLHICPRSQYSGSTRPVLNCMREERST